MQKEKYPSFAHENMTVKFVFSAENNGRVVKGNDGKNYKLFVSADGTQIHALEVLAMVPQLLLLMKM